MSKSEYVNKVIGTRLILQENCEDEDFLKLGKKLPSENSRKKYVLTKCLNCNTIFPSNLSTLKRCPPKKCCFCSGVGFKGEGKIIRNTYFEFEDYCEILILYKDTSLTCYIDKEDKNKVKKYSWRISKKKNKFYVVTGNAKNKTLLYLHNLLMDKTSHSDGNEVDHIDGNSLNNRKSNLRIVSRLENIQNVNARIDNKIGIRGISQIGKKFKVDFSYNNIRYYFKDWKTIEEAVYCRMVAEQHFDLHMLERNPLAQQYLTLSEDQKNDIYQYTLNKILGN